MNLAVIRDGHIELQVVPGDQRWIIFPLGLPGDNVRAALGFFGIGAVEPTRDVLYTSVARLAAHVGQQSATGATQQIGRTRL